MSDETERADLAEFLQTALQIPRQIVLDESFWALDASMMAFMHHTTYGEELRTNSFQMKRTGPTMIAYSTWVLGLAASEIEYGAIMMRAVTGGGHRTHLVIQDNPTITADLQPLAQAMISHFFGTFIQYIATDRREMQALLDSEPTPPIQGTTIHPVLKDIFRQLQPARRPGRPLDEDTRRAQLEIAAGRDYASTLQAWMQWRGIDTNDPKAVARARDLFRKTVAKKSGRN